jgi:hypothetical protein
MRLSHRGGRTDVVAALAGHFDARGTVALDEADDAETGAQEEQSSGPHRTRVRCSTEFAGWPDCADDRHRAGESQNRTAEPCLQYRRLVTLERMAAV